MSQAALYSHPPIQPRSTEFVVRVDGQVADVLSTRTTDFVCLCFEGGAQFEVEVQASIEKARVRPLSRGIAPAIDGCRLTFTMPRAACVSVEIDGRKPLFIFASAPDATRPAPADPNVIYFKGGQVHEVGELRLGTGQTLYIEGGAVVRGCIRADDARDIRIAGHGILDGSCYRQPQYTYAILLQRCQNVLIEGITIIEPSNWMVVLNSCRQVVVRRLQEIGEVVTSDGIDVVGCRDVLIEDCFLRNNDDCVVVKALSVYRAPSPPPFADVDGVLVQRCVLVNDRAGNAMEIGHELRCDHVRNVTFRDIDVLSVHGHGAVFSIHNGDHAVVENILWEDIRVEHHFDKLIDFRVVISRASRDPQRGHVRNVTLRNIQVTRTRFNGGHTSSLIGGLDAGHLVEDVTIENLTLAGERITDPDQIDLFMKQTRNVRLI